jgi:hypothetical protein
MTIRVLLLIIPLLTGCSGTIVSGHVTDESKATGIRYFEPAKYELAVFSVSEDGKTFTPIGDRVLVTMPDTKVLKQVSYQGSYFSSVTFKVELNNDGTLKSASLQNDANAAADSLSALNTLFVTGRDFESTRTQRQIDDLQREINLQTLKKQLEE